MSQTAVQTFTRGEVQDLLSKFATENPHYRAALLSDPKAIIEKQFGTSLGDIKVRAVSDTGDTAYVVLPYVPAEGELQDSDLSIVAGGKGDPNINASCVALGGSFNTVNQIAF
jgi:hypothetical protein